MSNHKPSLTEYLILFVILAFAAFATFIPHLDYAYPVHGDEWMHMTYSEAIVQTGNTSYVEPFQGQSTSESFADNPENGFYILFALLQQISGINFTDIFVYFPVIFFIITVLGVYALGRREGFGLEAAFLTSLIPTSIGILGPAFMVPLSLGLLIVPLILFLAFNHRGLPAYILLFMFSCFLLLVHVPSAIIAIIVLVPFIILNFKGDFKQSLGISLALALPFLIVFSLINYFATITNYLSTGTSLSSFVKFPDLLQSYGIIPVILGGVGIAGLFIKGGKKNLGLLFGFAVLLLVLLVFVRLGFGLDILYQRGLIYVPLLLSIIAGAGLSWLTGLITSFKFVKNNLFKKYLSVYFYALSVILILVIAVPTRLSTDYYHMVDQTDYESFSWIKSNLGADYQVALLDPWKATAFSALTQKYTARRIFEQREPVDDKIDAFLQSGASDTSVLRDNNISIVYNRNECENTDLNKIKDNIYLINSVSTNMLQNAGFERLGLDKPYPWWTWSQNCQADFSFPEIGLNDSQSVSVSTLANAPYDPWPQAMWGQSVAVQAGKSYLIGGWIKTDNVTGYGGAEIAASWNGAGDNWLSTAEFMKFVQGTNGWTYYEGRVTAPAGAVTCGVVCTLGGCSGTAWFDDLVFEELPAAGNN